jgi:hypothetical protein
MENKPQTKSNPIAWFGRFIVFLCTFGYVFPHVLTETMDMDAYDKEARESVE